MRKKSATVFVKENYRGLSYYGPYVGGSFKDKSRIDIRLAFDNDYLNTVMKGCKNYDYWGFTCMKDELLSNDSWYLQYRAYFKSVEERDVAICDLKILCKLLGISNKVTF